MAASVGRYELLRELGRGGMAEVFLAKRRGPGGVEKRLALKRIRRERASDPRLLSMFVHEARLSMTLAHKNIVPMFDFGRVGDELFLVMEYVDGADLAAAMSEAKRRDRPMAPVVAAYVALEACQALEYAHRVRDEGGDEREIVHRDVTPRNVLLSYSGEVKLADFGVATTETDLGGAGKVRGTPSYMAPEQARGEQVDSRADIFSLGLVLYEMLVGKRAYRGKSTEERLELARAGAVPRLPDRLPETLHEIVARATAPELDDRYQTAREMQLGLDRYMVSAREPGSPPPGVQLADWLAEVAPSDQVSRELRAEKAPAGAVVTFLDDGAEELARITTMAAGDETMRSIAETAIESEAASQMPDEEAEPPASVHDATVAEPVGGHRFYRTVWLLVLAGAVAAGGAIFIYMTGGDGDDAPAIAPAPADAGTATQALSIDAMAAAQPPVDAAPAVADAAPIDARRRKVVVDRPPRTSAADAAPVAAPGIVKVSSSPWARVSVVGRSETCAETPCELSLPPGDYTLRLHNPVANLGKTVQVKVVSGETARIVEALTRSAGP